jgi:hypothetical protein
MPSKKSLANLKRGGIKGTPETAARARAAKAKQHAELDRLGELAGDDPHAAYDELHAIMTRHIVKLLRAEEREGREPSRNVTDRLREYRQTTEALSEYRRARGSDAEAEAFFAQLDARMAAVIERVGEPQPAVEPPPAAI